MNIRPQILTPHRRIQTRPFIDCVQIGDFVDARYASRCVYIVHVSMDAYVSHLDQNCCNDHVLKVERFNISLFLIAITAKKNTRNPFAYSSRKAFSLFYH